jgi:hypothetical protein
MGNQRTIHTTYNFIVLWSIKMKTDKLTGRRRVPAANISQEQNIMMWPGWKGLRLCLLCWFLLALVQSAMHLVTDNIQLRATGFEILTAITGMSVACWYVTPCDVVEKHTASIFRAKCVWHVLFLLFTCLAHPFALMMEVVCSSEASINFYQTTRCYIPVVTAMITSN